MNSTISAEEYLVSRLREARKEYETEINGDVPFISAIRQYVTGNVSSELRALSENTMSRSLRAGTLSGTGLMYPLESRTISVASTNGVTITEEVFDLLGAIRNRLVLSRAGCKFLTGLKGNVSFAAYTGSNVHWAGETDAAQDGKGNFLNKTMTPKRLTAYVNISKQMLLQNNVQADRFIMNDFVQAITSELQAAILGNHEHSDIKPDGIFTSADLKMTGKVDYKKIVGLQSEVYDQALSYCYLTSGVGYGVLKNTLRAKDVSEGFIVDANKRGMSRSEVTCADYPIFVTNDMPEIDGEHGIAFGDFSELIIGQWGDLDITIDPYTKATDGEVRLIVNAWFDAIVRRDNAIVVGSFV